MPVNKNTVCLWFERNAKEAARFPTALFPQSSLGAIRRAPSSS